MTKDMTQREMEEHISFLQAQLQYLKTLPFLRVNPNDPSQQKPTPAAKQYKELMQQYINLVKAYDTLLDKADAKNKNSDIPEAFATFLESTEEDE